jgi:hypothetical protein
MSSARNNTKDKRYKVSQILGAINEQAGDDEEEEHFGLEDHGHRFHEEDNEGHKKKKKGKKGKTARDDHD